MASHHGNKRRGSKLRKDGVPAAVAEEAIKQLNAEEDGNDEDNPKDVQTPSSSSATSESICCQYDLYAVVHHQGAMGEGHYVTTVRKFSKAQQKLNRTFGSSSSLASKASMESAGDSSSGSNEEEWTCYNDGFVSTVKREEIAASPSAYVLFYIRKDVQGKSIDSIFTYETESDDSSSHNNSRDGDTATVSSSNSSSSAYKTPTKAARNSHSSTGPHQQRGHADNGRNLNNNDDSEEGNGHSNNKEGNSDGCRVQ
jgi:hypothetical protein